MNYQPNENVIVLDTTFKPAGTGMVLSHNPNSDYYKIRFRYNNSEKEEEIEIPQHRLLRVNDFN